jgi:hypothetical protein
MRLILIGCEYAGKTTLAVEISKWMIEALGLPFVRWHNHFVVPHIDQHLVVRAQGDDRIPVPGKAAADELTEEEQEQILALKPALLEQFQRHMIWRHLVPSFYSNEDDYLLINWYYADAVYAPLYYGYGEPGSFGRPPAASTRLGRGGDEAGAGHGAGARRGRGHRGAHAAAPARPVYSQSAGCGGRVGAL